jgi:hypothetical protein
MCVFHLDGRDIPHISALYKKRYDRERERERTRKNVSFPSNKDGIYVLKLYGEKVGILDREVDGY